MPRRIDRDLERSRAELGPVLYDPLAAVGPDAELETPPLPRDLPPWARDAIAVSQRARDLIARLKPAIVRVLTFWDHRVRNAIVGGRRLDIDASGSYRIVR